MGRRATLAREYERLLRGKLLALRHDFAGAARAYGEAVSVAPDLFDAWFQHGIFPAAEPPSRGARRALAQQDPVAHLPELASALTNLGVLHRVENRQVESLQAYEEALPIRRALAAKNPEVYLPAVAATLNNLGTLHRDGRRRAKSLTASPSLRPPRTRGCCEPWRTTWRRWGSEVHAPDTTGAATPQK